MSLKTDVLKALKDVITMNERIARLERESDKQDTNLLDVRDRVTRVEVFLELLRGAAPRRGSGRRQHRELEA
ncbi:MAG: hypothetical protein JO104_06115 [Candidatus Eremiobacteraeota bacterium]|nr:hypothetical protein [Candidatus Eremiobacteraeota bacterium]